MTPQPWYVMLHVNWNLQTGEIKYNVIEGTLHSSSKDPLLQEQFLCDLK